MELSLEPDISQLAMVSQSAMWCVMQHLLLLFDRARAFAAQRG